MKITKKQLFLEIIESYKLGGSILACGNGGSATQANHLAEELVGRYKRDRNPIKALSLASDTGIITCISNDYGFDNIFSRQIECMASENDILLCLSTSGNSPNIVKALEKASLIGIKAILITGNKYDSKIHNDKFLFYKVEKNESRNVQEDHLVLIHDIIEKIEENLL
tara:strand:+ start:5913 stop:6416 length:504 start_codon:yes stop_codon:yes gene_type:complete